MYNIIVSSTARKELKEISKAHREAIISALEEIREEPLAGKPLTRELSGKFSYKVGVFRIIYKVNKRDKLIYVLSAGHRAIIYK